MTVQVAGKSTSPSASTTTASGLLARLVILFRCRCLCSLVHHTPDRQRINYAGSRHWISYADAQRDPLAATSVSAALDGCRLSNALFCFRSIPTYLPGLSHSPITVMATC